MKKNEELLRSGPFRQLLLTLCLPTIAVMLVMVVYNMADTFFIGKTGDPNQIAAVNLCGPVFTIFSAIGTLLGSGGCTAISMALGKRDTSSVKAVTSLCTAGALVLGAALTAGVLLALEPLCVLLGADETTMAFTKEYLGVFALGAPLVLWSQIFGNIIRADGGTVLSMVGNLVGTISNILLDALFILVFHWGVRGAALATVIGNLISAACLLVFLRKKESFSLSPRDMRLNKVVVLPVLTLGLPMFFSTTLNSVSHVLSNRLMMGYGSVPMAAQGVAGKLGLLISMLMMGICMGMQPAVSYNFGAKSYGRMADILKKTGLFAVSVSIVLGAAGLLFKDRLIAAFIDDAEVIAYGRIMVFASLLTGPFYAMHQLCQLFLQATGKALYASTVSILDKGLVFIPVLYIMNHFFHAYGVAFTGAATLLISLGVSVTLSLRWAGRIKRQGEKDEKD